MGAPSSRSWLKCSRQASQTATPRFGSPPRFWRTIAYAFWSRSTQVGLVHFTPRLSASRRHRSVTATRPCGWAYVEVVRKQNGVDEITARIAQAQGMVSAQVDCTVIDALVLMQARAELSKVDLTAIASAVLDGSIRFDD